MTISNFVTDQDPKSSFPKNDGDIANFVSDTKNIPNFVTDNHTEENANFVKDQLKPKHPLKAKSLQEEISDIIRWNNPSKTGIIFGVFLLCSMILAYLICMAIFPAISLVAYTSLVVIIGIISFQLCKTTLLI